MNHTETCRATHALHLAAVCTPALPYIPEKCTVDLCGLYRQRRRAQSVQHFFSLVLSLYLLSFVLENQAPQLLCALCLFRLQLQEDVSFFAPGIFRLPSTYRPISRAVATVVPAGSLLLFVDSLILLTLEKGKHVNLFPHVLSRVYPPLFLNYCLQTGLPSTHFLVSLYLGDIAFQRSIAVAATVLSLLGCEGTRHGGGSEPGRPAVGEKKEEAKGDKTETAKEEKYVSKKG